MARSEIRDRDQDFAGFRALALPAPQLPAEAARRADLGIQDVANAAALTAIDVTNLTVASRRVLTYLSVFDLDSVTSRSPVADVVIASGDPAKWWVRRGYADPSWQIYPFVSVNWSTGSNEAIGFGTSKGASDAAPLKSLDELNRRFPGDGYGGNMPTIHLMGDYPLSEADRVILTRLKSKSIDAQVLFIGDKTSVAIGGGFTGLITGYTAASPATNGEAQMTIASLPASNSWTSLVGKMIQRADGAKTSFVLADRGSKTARIKWPDTSNPLASTGAGRNGVPTDFVIGETVVVYDLSSLPVSPLPTDLPGYQDNIIVANVHINQHGATLPAAEMALGATTVEFIQCRLTDPVMFGGLTTTWSSVLIDGDAINVAFWGSAKGVVLNNCAMIGTGIIMDYSELSLTGTFCAERNNVPTFQMRRGRSSVQTTACACGVFNLGTWFINGSAPTSLTDEGGNSPIYGAGNTVAIINQPAGTSWSIDRTHATATTSAAHPMVIAGIGHDFSETFPLSDISTMTSMNDT